MPMKRHAGANQDSNQRKGAGPLVKRRLVRIAPSAAAATTVAAAATTSAAAATVAAAAATTAAATTEAAAAPATTTAAAAATTTLFGRSGFVNGQGSTVELLPVERCDGRVGLRLIRHDDEAESARLTGKPVCDQGHFLDLAMLREQFANTVLRCLETEIAYEDLHVL
jgi:hypothetical protein